MYPIAPLMLVATVFAGIAATSVPVIAADPSTTESYYDKHYDFSHLRTFDFKVQRRISRDPIADNRIWADLIRTAAQTNLQTHGFRHTPGEGADVLVAFYVGLTERYDVHVMDYGFPGYWGPWRYGWYWGWPGNVDVWTIPYTDSTLIVDVIDAKSNQLVWRGFNTDMLDLDDVEEDFDDAVGDVLKRFYKDIKLGQER
jgi:hypothetical protein